MLTKAQFDAALAAGNINENEIYNTIDEIDEDDEDLPDEMDEDDEDVPEEMDDEELLA